MKTFSYFLILSLCGLLIGCISTKAQLSGTNVITPYGMANTINGEVEANVGN